MTDLSIGIFGCGKTLVQASLAKLLSELGKHVLLVAPTNAAVQAISETLLKYAPEVNAVRVVFADAAKLRAFGRENQKHDLALSSELTMFHLLQDLTTENRYYSRHSVVPEHDLS